MAATATGIEDRILDARIEGFRRLLPALVLSAIAHLLLAQWLPDAVKAYGAAPVGTPLTVSIQSATPPVQVKIARRAIPVSRNTAAAAIPESITPEAVNPIADHKLVPQATAALEDRNESSSSEPETPALPLLDYYYQSREVDTPAQAVGDALLIYPREALRLHLSGEVHLRLFIDESGKLIRSEVIKANPAGIFEEAAVQAVNTMQFSPARKADKPVRSQRSVLITFDPNPSEVSSSVSQ